MKKGQWVRITPEGVEVSGKPLATSAHGVALLTEVYRGYVNDYPKFFRMDELSKLGFLAVELLLRTDGESVLTGELSSERRHSDSDDRAVILFGRSGSIASDRRHQATIEDKDNFFPSPSVFVYTLPNIVTGEIAIRNRYHGETAFYVLDEYDEPTIHAVVESTFSDSTTQSIICGWVDYESENCFEVSIQLITKE